LPGLDRLSDSFVGQCNVGPTRKTVFLVPHAFTMAQQHELKHESSSLVKNFKSLKIFVIFLVFPITGQKIFD
jgi:hypothetical protein